MLLRQLLQERNLSVNRGLPACTQFTLVATGRMYNLASRGLEIHV